MNWRATSLVFLLSVVCRAASSVPSTDGWRWYSDDFRMRIRMVQWNPIAGNPLREFETKGTPSEVDAEGPVRSSSRCLRQEIGPMPRCVTLRIERAGHVEILREAWDLRSLVGMVNTESKAVALVTLLGPNLERIEGHLVGWVGYSQGDYLVMVFQNYTFGYGSHAPRGVLYRVASDGFVRKIAEEPMKKLSS